VKPDGSHVPVFSLVNYAHLVRPGMCCGGLISNKHPGNTSGQTSRFLRCVAETHKIFDSFKAGRRQQEAEREAQAELLPGHSDQFAGSVWKQHHYRGSDISFARDAMQGHSGEWAVA
jgi:hypothetical protein